MTSRVLSPISPPPEEELDLVQRAQRGDLDAFEVIVARYEPRILRLARHMLGNDADAEDVLQETFFKVFAKLHQFHHQSRLYTWIVRIAVNESLMKIRRRRNNVVSLDQEIETDDGPLVLESSRVIADHRPNPEQQLETTELGTLLESALNDLSLPYRAVFQLRDVEELSTEETADALGISPAAVKSRLLRARLRLRNRLARQLQPQSA